MKVFLSHSSKDKGYVNRVAENLRPGTYELDSETFDAGVLNSIAIIESLKRCDLYCLFLSQHSLSSSYVNFETSLGVELIASGKISQVLIICIDDSAFKSTGENARFFNIVRKNIDPVAASRLIQGHLISVCKSTSENLRPFIGRENELKELERQVIDTNRPPPKSLFVSGNFGSGRRTISKKFFANQYPWVNNLFPIISIDEFFGLEEIYRSLLSCLRPNASARMLSTQIQSFAIADEKQKKQLIAQLANSVLSNNEAIIFFDKGGVLSASGQLSPEFDALVELLEWRPHPPAIIISHRMIPLRFRRNENDLSYLRVQTLDVENSTRLILTLLRQKNITISSEQLDQLVKLGDGHPYNIYRMIEEINERSLSLFLANPLDYIDWKHRQSSEYLEKIKFSNNEESILSLLNLIPELDFEGIVGALEMNLDAASEALARMIDLHVVESVQDRFAVSPPLRIAVERDKRFKFGDNEQKSALQYLADTLTIRLEDGSAPIALVDAAIYAQLNSDTELSELSSALLLPSHSVWMAKKHYDAQNWPRSLAFAKEALKGKGRISASGYIAANRYLCLSASRLGKDEDFDEGMRRLMKVSRDDWSESNILFLKGFNLRLKGNLPAAEEAFRGAYALTPGNVSAAREIASICLSRDNFYEAEKFARQAFDFAPTNSFIVDMLIAILIRKFGSDKNTLAEINELFSRLEKVGEESGRSFFSTRKAEFEHLWGDNKIALKLIQEAVQKTPRIFEPQRLYAEILIKEGQLARANDVLRKMRDMVDVRDPNERKSNYGLYLKTRVIYLTEVGAFDEAKKMINDQNVFTRDEIENEIRRIDVVQGFKSNNRN